MFEFNLSGSAGARFFPPSQPKKLSGRDPTDSLPNVYEEFLRSHQQAAQKRVSPHAATYVRNPYNPLYREVVAEIPRSHSQSTISSNPGSSSGSYGSAYNAAAYNNGMNGLPNNYEQLQNYAPQQQYIPPQQGNYYPQQYPTADGTRIPHEIPRSSSEYGYFDQRSYPASQASLELERLRAGAVYSQQEKEAELREQHVRQEKEKHALILQNRTTTLVKDHEFEIYKLTQKLQSYQRNGEIPVQQSPQQPNMTAMHAMEPDTPSILDSAGGINSTLAIATLPSTTPPTQGRPRSSGTAGVHSTATSSHRGINNQSNQHNPGANNTVTNNSATSRRRNRHTTPAAASLADTRDPDQDTCVTLFTVLTVAHLLIIQGTLTLIIILATSTSSILQNVESDDTNGDQIYIVDHSADANRRLQYVYILTTAASVTVLGLVWISYNILGRLMQYWTGKYNGTQEAAEKAQYLSRYTTAKRAMRVLRIIGIQQSFQEVLNMMVYFVLCGTTRKSQTSGGQAGVFVLGAVILIWLIFSLMLEVVQPFLDEVDVLKEHTRTLRAVTIPPNLKMTPSETQQLSIEEKALSSIAVALFEFPHHSQGEDTRLRRMRQKKVKQAPLSRPQIAAHTRLHWAVPSRNTTADADRNTCVICMCPIESGNIEQILRSGTHGVHTDTVITHAPTQLPASKSLSIMIENDEEEKQTDGVQNEDVILDIPSISSDEEVKSDIHTIEQKKTEEKTSKKNNKKETTPLDTLPSVTVPASTSLPNGFSDAEHSILPTRKKEYVLSSVVEPGDLEQQVESIELVRTLPCLHSFHKACAEQWLATRPTCPLCRQHVVQCSRQGRQLTQNTHKDVDDLDDYIHDLPRHHNRGYMEPLGDWVQIRYEEEWEPFVTTVNNTVARAQFSPRMRTPTVIRLNRDRMRAQSQLQRRQYLENQLVDQGIRTSRRRSTGEQLAAIGPPRQIRRADSETEATLRVDMAVTMTRERRSNGRRVNRRE